LAALKKRYEEWITSYSRIENFLVNNSDCILQIRTADNQFPKFAMLFFDNKDFHLKNSYFCDHLFLTEQGGIYYFLEGGNPGVDESAGKLVIRTYKERQ
jgi:hypothetical protein